MTVFYGRVDNSAPRFGTTGTTHNRLDTSKASKVDTSDFQCTRGIYQKTVPRTGDPRKSFSTMTYNLKNFVYPQFSEPREDTSDYDKLFQRQLNDFSRELERITQLGKTIRKENSDVVLLQEVASLEDLKVFMAQNQLSKSYPNVIYYPVSGTHYNPMIYQHGLAILSKAEVRPHSPAEIIQPKCPRPIAETTLDLGNGESVHLFNLHLKSPDKNCMNGSEDRVTIDSFGRKFFPTWMLNQFHIEKLASHLKNDILRKNPNARIVVAGDFNAMGTGTIQSYEHLLGLKRVPFGQPTHRLGGELDYILVSNNLTPSDTHTVEQTASDHKPLKTVLELKTVEPKDCQPHEVAYPSRPLGTYHVIQGRIPVLDSKGKHQIPFLT